MCRCALTERQTALVAAHGTVEEFTDAVVMAIGEISVAEAQDAIAKYRRQFAEAGSPHQTSAGTKP